MVWSSILVTRTAVVGVSAGAPAGIDAVVPLHVLHHEHQVVDDERVAVGPPGAGAQLQGDGEAVVRHRVAGGDVGHDVQRLLVHGQEVDVEHLGGQLAAALVHEPDRLRHPQRAAVAADAVAEHLLHHRIDRDALLHGRQLAGSDPGRQHRRLAEPPAHRRTGASAGGRALLRIAGSKRERRRHQQGAGCQPSPRHPNLHHGNHLSRHGSTIAATVKRPAWVGMGRGGALDRGAPEGRSDSSQSQP